MEGGTYHGWSQISRVVVRPALVVKLLLSAAQRLLCCSPSPASGFFLMQLERAHIRSSTT